MERVQSSLAAHHARSPEKGARFSGANRFSRHGSAATNSTRHSIIDKVKLVVVHRDSPDVETELGIFPSKDAAMPAF
jgi:hypothetical protein